MPVPKVTCFPHEGASNTCVYVVEDTETKTCAVIDPVADFTQNAAKCSYEHADTVVQYIRDHGLTNKWILETHAHADHISGAPHIKECVGGDIAIGAQIKLVQETFRGIYHDDRIPVDGTPFDKLFDDGELFTIGSLDAKVMYTPGHTPACATYVIGDCLFVGDTVFQPDVGTARCDFPHGSAEDLWNSIQKILAFPDKTRFFVCHDYPNDRPFRWETTVGEQKANNKHVKSGTTKDEFLSFRTQRDAVLHAPALLLPSLQCNVRAGKLPEVEENGISYLKIPLNQFEK